MSFLSDYRESFDWLEGMLPFDAALLFTAYNSLIAQHGISGPTLEIGVHRGASAVLIAALRKSSQPFVAIDLFSELQDHNVSKSGSGNREIFLANMTRFHGDIAFVQIIASPSAAVTPAQLGNGYSFCHIDGGHSSSETYSDLMLCSSISLPSGLIALDDYFNPNFPGVSEGTVKYMLENPGKLRPIALGYNKVIFQRAPVSFDINSAFADEFRFVPRVATKQFGYDSFLYPAPLEYFFDLDRSTPMKPVPRSEMIRATLRADVTEVRARPNQRFSIPIHVRNESTIPFQFGGSPIGVSYHLRGCDQRILAHDNVRTYFNDPLLPGQERILDVLVAAPATSGHYILEFDLVWEQICWFKDQGSPTLQLPLVVM